MSKPNVCAAAPAMCYPHGLYTVVYCPPIENVDAARVSLRRHMAHMLRRTTPYVLVSDADAPAWDNGTCAILRTPSLAQASAEPWCALAWMERRFMP